jgi:hypothetical protein
MGKLAGRVLLPVGCAIAMLLGLAAVGRWSRESLQQDPRYYFDFMAIDCTPPVGQSKREFLGEVQYLASLPNQLSLIGNDLAERLQGAFARHPWVEQVEKITLSRQRIEVRMRYRKPVLAILWDGKMRVVDRAGILLPATAVTEGLPVYPRAPAPPAGPAGTPWGDPDVVAAARAAARS